MNKRERKGEKQVSIHGRRAEERSKVFKRCTKRDEDLVTMANNIAISMAVHDGNLSGDGYSGVDNCTNFVPVLIIVRTYDHCRGLYLDVG